MTFRFVTKLGDSFVNGYHILPWSQELVSGATHLMPILQILTLLRSLQ